MSCRRIGSPRSKRIMAISSPIPFRRVGRRALPILSSRTPMSQSVSANMPMPAHLKCFLCLSRRAWMLRSLSARLPGRSGSARLAISEKCNGLPASRSALTIAFRR